MLVSPGTEVKVIDETFHSSSAVTGTIPVIFLASAENKINASETGIAAGTLKSNSEIPILVSSQRELADMFGDPLFYNDINNTPLHGNELNEYGLQAAYSFLGSNNRAWILRADLDMGQLMPNSQSPSGDPLPGTVWLDTSRSEWGIFVWNASKQQFEKKVPIIVEKEDEVTYGTSSVNGTDGYIPKSSIGAVGTYAIVFGSTVAKIFYRNQFGTWVLLGSPQWKGSFPTFENRLANPYYSPISATIEINGTSVEISFNATSHGVLDISNSINSANIQGVTATGNDNILRIYSDGTSGVNGELEIGGDDELMDELGIDVESGGTKVFHGLELHIDKHTNIPLFKKRDSEPRPTGSVWIKTTEFGGGSAWSVKEWNDETKMWTNVPAPLYMSHEVANYEFDSLGGGIGIPAGEIYVQYNVAADTSPLGTFKVYRREPSEKTTVIGNKIGSTGIPSGSYTLKFASTDSGSPSFSDFIEVPFTANGDIDDSEIIAGAIAGSNIPNVYANVTSDNRIKLEHVKGGEIRMIDDETTPVLSNIGFSAFINNNVGTPNLYYSPGTDGSTSPKSLHASNWKSTIEMGGSQVSFYVPSVDEITSTPNDGQLWFSSIVDEIDIMINDGTNWVGYHNYGSGYEQCDPNGPIVSSTLPLMQSTGASLVTGDLWIDTSDLENFPIIRRYNADAKDTYGFVSDETLNGLPRVLSGWELVDVTDQSSDNGVLFADARYNVSGSNSDVPGDISEMLTSDFLDTDAPDPVLYPRGMLLWNTRRSGFNVKRFVKDYVDTMRDNVRYYDEPMDSYYPHRWVTYSRNQENGVGSFGRVAQRQVVIQSLQSMINSNEEIRDTESKTFNLMAAPGYPELISEMVSLNYDRRLSSLIVGDSPARLNPGTTSIYEWSSNKNMAPYDSDDGLVTSDEYMAVYYPWGLTSDNAGNDVVVPPSHMMLKTIAYSDSVSYPWFAPAGPRRGRITNASSVGYINDENEYRPIALNDGQRDTLYENNVNPIAFINGTGIIAHGQKTRGTGVMDRINVARLIIHLRRQLELVTRPFIYQPNDKLTRDEVKNVINGLLLELMGLRAISDFLVVCDETNNTPTRIRRDELWVDIAIEPIRAVEFIYVPLRLRNTGQMTSS